MIGKSDDTGEFFNARKIVKNKIRCKKCGDIIESVSVNDFKFCKCGAVRDLLDKKVPKAQIARIMGVQKITLRRFIKRMGWLFILPYQRAQIITTSIQISGAKISSTFYFLFL